MTVLLRRAWAFLIVASLGACLAQAAAALDLNTVTPPQQKKPDWAGFYIKDNSSGGSDSVTWTTLGPSSGFSTPAVPASSVNKSFGYNFQAGNFVFGLEGSLAAANFDGRFTSPYSLGVAAGAGAPNVNWMGAVTGRLGYSFGQWLPYIKGGFATANVASPLQAAGAVGTFAPGAEVNGWTAGIGFENKLSSKWSLGLEYLYTDLGSGPATGAMGSLAGAALSGSPEVYSTALKSQSLFGRLNYKPAW
jgi:opacity protein-like surface antigen